MCGTLYEVREKHNLVLNERIGTEIAGPVSVNLNLMVVLPEVFARDIEFDGFLTCLTVDTVNIISNRTKLDVVLAMRIS